MNKALREFFDWWLAGLAWFVPARLRSWRERPRAYLVVSVDDDGYRLGLVEARAGATHELDVMTVTAATSPALIRQWVGQHGKLPKLETVFRLPAHDCLVREMSIPKMPRASIKPMLAFELDRQTPFRRDQVYYDFVVRPAKDDKTMALDLVVAPRSAVAPHMQRLGELGLRADIIDCDDRPFQSTGLNLQDEGAAERGGSRRVLVQRVAIAVVVLALVAAGIWIPIDRNAARIAELEAQQVELRRDAAVVAALRRQLADLDSRSSFVSELRRTGPSVLDVLAEVTRLFPDDSWVLRFEIKNDSITLQGESTNATRLIEILERSSLVARPRFTSPVTLNSATGKERFRIALQVDAAEAET